jgi:hypothetical protein
MPCRLATTYAKPHHDIPSLPPEPSPPTSNDDEYIDASEDDESSGEEADEEVEPPPCASLKAALAGSFKSTHRESTTRVVRKVVFKQMNTAIGNRITEISVEFAK